MRARIQIVTRNRGKWDWIPPSSPTNASRRLQSNGSNDGDNKIKTVEKEEIKP